MHFTRGYNSTQMLKDVIQMGIFVLLSAAVHRAQYGESDRDILLDDTHCSGLEENILECLALNSQLGDTIQCHDSKLAAVICGGWLNAV